jgi:HEAT repeat protein
LIQDLRNESREARTYAIKILSLIKDKEILKELKAMTFDQDWIVKLYLIKAFSRFDKDDVKDTLEELIKDPDPDVRESADKILTKFN